MRSAQGCAGRLHMRLTLAFLRRVEAVYRSRDHIGYRAEKRKLVRSEHASLRRVHAQDAERLVLAANDHASTSSNAVLAQERGVTKYRNASQIFHDDRCAASQRVASLRTIPGVFNNLSGNPPLPPLGSNDCECVVDWIVAKDLRELDTEDAPGDSHCLLENIGQGLECESTPAKRGNGVASLATRLSPDGPVFQGRITVGTRGLWRQATVWHVVDPGVRRMCSTALFEPMGRTHSFSFRREPLRARGELHAFG